MDLFLFPLALPTTAAAARTVYVGFVATTPGSAVAVFATTISTSFEVVAQCEDLRILQRNSLQPEFIKFFLDYPTPDFFNAADIVVFR